MGLVNRQLVQCNRNFISAANGLAAEASHWGVCACARVPGRPSGFRGGLTAGKYSTITGACSGTITRDLADVVVNGTLLREGERRHARYPLCSPLPPVQHVTSNDGGAMAEERQCGLIRKRVGVKCTPPGNSSRPTNLIASTD